MDEASIQAIEEFEEEIKNHGDLAGINYLLKNFHKRNEPCNKKVLKDLLEYITEREEMFSTNFYIYLGTKFYLSATQEQKIMLKILTRGNGSDKINLFNSSFIDKKNRKIILENIILYEPNYIKIVLLNFDLSSEERKNVLDSILTTKNFNDLILLFYLINKLSYDEAKTIIDYVIPQLNISEKISLIFSISFKNKKYIYKMLIYDIFEDLYLLNDLQTMSDFIYNLLSRNMIEDEKLVLVLKKKYEELTGKKYVRVSRELKRKDD